MKKKPLDYTDSEIDSIIELKWRARVMTPDNRAYVSNQEIGKLLDLSASSVRLLYLKRFR